MQKIIFILYLVLLATACKYRSTQKTDEAIRIDSIIANYIRYTNNNLLRQNHQHNIADQWIQDGAVDHYLAYEIGHDAADKDGKNKRFIIDERIYVDTAKRTVCIYDIFTNTLRRWKR